MYAPLELAYLILALVLPGHCLLRAVGLKLRDDRLAWLGWCVGAGALLAGSTLFAWYWALPGTLTIARLSVVQALQMLLLLLVAKRCSVEGEASESEPGTPTPRWERSLFGLVVALVLLSACSDLVLRNRSPALRGDEGQFWGVRAQAIHETGGLGRDYSALLATFSVPHRDYPLLDTLLIAWTYEKRGEVGFSFQRLPLQLIVLATLLALAGALRRRTRPLLAAAVLLLVASSSTINKSLASAGADGLVALGVLLAVDGWWRWQAAGQRKYAALAAIGLGLAVASKNEGLLYASCGLAVLIVLELLRISPLRSILRGDRAKPGSQRPRFRAWSLLCLTLVLVPAGLQFAFNEVSGFENDLTSGMGKGVGFLARLQEQAVDHFAITSQFYVENILLDIDFDGYLILLVFAALLVSPSRLRDPRMLGPLCFLALSMTGVFLVYLSTPQPLEWHLATSACRVVGQVLPVAALSLAGLLGDAASARELHENR